MATACKYVSVVPVFANDGSGTPRMDLQMVIAGAADQEPTGEPDRDFAAPRPQPTTEMLMPSGWPGVFKDRFSLLVSRHAFEGWVHQPSPCCGAASVAGAANCALGLPHDSPLALTHAHVAGLYHSMLADQAAKKQDAVARLLGIESIEPALEALRADLAADGKSLGGRKEAACKAKEAMLRLRTLCEDGGPSDRPDDDGRQTPDAEVQMWTALWEVLHTLRGTATNGGVLEEVTAAAGNEEEEEPAGEDSAGGGALCAGGGGFAAKVRSELKTLLSKLGGCEQLAPGVARPSTFFIGNWGIHAAVRALKGPAFDGDNDIYSDEHDERLAELRHDAHQSGRAALCSRLRSRTLVGQRCKGQTPPPIQLRKSDDEEAIETAWVALKAAFSEPRCGLILHQKGHYSLVYALREWVEDDTEDGVPGRRVRELLTCRKGQRPTLWIDWTEVHGYITGWTGYAMMEVSASA